MKERLLLWERVHALREAVEEIVRAGLVPAGEEEKARGLFPDPGPRAGWLGRALACLFVSTAIGMLTWALADVFRLRSAAAIGFLVCSALVLATELLLALPRLAFSGAAGATGFWCWVAFTVLSLELLDRTHAAAEIALPFAALAAAAAAWRWGLPLHGLLAAGAVFFWLARWPHGRLLVLLAAALLVPLLARRLDRPEAPSHRDALAFALGTVLAALYAALNIWSVRERLVEEIGGRRGSAGAVSEPLAWGATFLVPAGILAWGLFSRRRWVLVLGGLFAALAGLTFRRYVHIAPAWALLVLSGSALALLSLGAIRFLKRRGEAAGFTDAPLLSRPEREEALTAVALVASQLSPAPGTASREEGSRFAAGGGDSGGGGASDRY